MQKPPEIYITRWKSAPVCVPWMMLRGIRRKVAGNGRAFASLTSRDRQRCNLRGEFLEMPAFVYGKIRRICMSETIEVGEHQNGQQIALLQQQTLRVTLPEVRTAGFRWALRTSANKSSRC